MKRDLEMNRTFAAAPRRAQGGFSLIELMIAVALGLIILAALTTFFVQTSANRAEMERNTRQIENGRYAIDTVREDLSLAGFYADLAPGVVPTWQVPDACPANIGALGFALAPAYTAPVPIFGYPLGDGAPACLQDLVPDNDILVIRRFNTEAVTPAVATTGDASRKWYVQISECAEDDPMVPFAVSAGSAGAGAFPLRKVTCGATVADLWKLREQVYYLRSCSVCAPSDGIPTLWRAELDPQPDGTIVKHSPLVEGIEAMRVDYGIDNTGDGLPDVWSRCDAATPCDATAWSNVTSAKMYIVARNLEQSLGHVDNKTYSLGLWGTYGPMNDAFKRHVYTATVSMPNRTGPREPQLAVAP
jgi:type IV pilus assembly protein PilW